MQVTLNVKKQTCKSHNFKMAVARMMGFNQRCADTPFYNPCPIRVRELQIRIRRHVRNAWQLAIRILSVSVGMPTLYVGRPIPTSANGWGLLGFATL